MDAFLLSPAMTPFTVALGLLFGLLALELIAALFGGSLLGMGGEADLDIDADFELDLDAPDADFDLSELELGEVDAAEGVEPSDAGALSWLGMGKAPFLVWLSAFLLAYGLGGMILQVAMTETVGFALPASVAGIALVPVGLGFARAFAGGFARLLPKSESEAVSANHLGRRRGVVSQGTAARGKPAEVRVMDGHGNTHYLRAEPLRDDQEYVQGTEVLVIRKSRNEGYRLVSLSD